MYELLTFPKEDPRTPDFYIQTVGDPGAPMSSPSANCWAVYADNVNLDGQYFYYAVLNAYNQGIFSQISKGTVQQFITMGDFYQLF